MRIPLLLCVLVGVCAAPINGAAAAIPASTATSAVLSSSFSPDRLGSRGALTFSIRYGGGFSYAYLPGGPRVPAAVRTLIVRFPAGMGLEIPNLNGCSIARLRAHGARGCSAASLIGRGSALTQLAAGSQILSERITLSVYVGPLRNGQPTLAILARGFTPLGERLEFGGEILFDHTPYGEELVLHLPPFPVLPEAPAASPVLFSLTLGTSRQRRSSRANTVIEPARCPRGGFPFAAESTYADGSTGTAVTKALCP